MEDLRKAIETAYVHCKPGGLAVFAPDWVRETFYSGVENGGSDGETESLRYHDWTWDPDPNDSQYVVDYIYALRDAHGSVRTEYDRHLEGVFSRQEWLGVLRDVGFEPHEQQVRHSEVDYPLDLFIATKPA
jgi:hypothetical protein